MNEEFEKWWSCTDEDMFQNHTKPEFKAAFLAGAAAMRENCAEVADNMQIDCPSDKCPEYTDMDDCMYKETGFCIAAAIRKIEVE